MKTLKTLTILAVIAPAAAMADDYSSSDLDKVRNAIASVGCVVNNDTQAAQVENATGFGEEELETIVHQLRGLGEIEDMTGQGRGIRLISGECEK